MTNVLQFPGNPELITAREFARRRWESGEFRGGGIWLVWEAQCRIQADLQDLYNMACGDPGGGQVNISAQFVAEKSLDALVWLAMAGEINRLAVAEFEKQTQ